jgi:hypothetical protein
MGWRTIGLHGATSIARVANLYEVQDLRGVPWSKYKIKVLDRGDDGFLAVPNVCVKDADGTPDWIAGLGRTEAEALQDAIKRFGEVLSLRQTWRPDDFEWSDPHDF